MSAAAVPLSSNWLRLQSKSKTKSVATNGKVTKAKKQKKTKEENRDKETTIGTTLKEKSKYKELKTVAVEELKPGPTEISIKPEEGNVSGRKLEPGKYLAIDCEFVGVGPEGTDSALARVSIVNFHGSVILDKYVKPKEKVTDWRTWVSGIMPKHMKDAISFREAQQLCSDLFKDRILVGHAIHHDLDSLMLSHPIYLIRDTSKHLPFRKISNGKTPGLKKLAKEFLKIEIQGGEHSSVEDARATMLLYRMHKKEFEIIHRQKFGNNHHHDADKSSRKK